MAGAVYRWRWSSPLCAALVWDGHVASAFRPGVDSAGEKEVSPSDLEEGHWVMLLKNERVASQRHGQGGSTGLHVLELLGTEADLAELVEAARGKVRFVEMAELLPQNSQSQPSSAFVQVHREPRRHDGTQALPADDDHGITHLPEEVVSALHRDPHWQQQHRHEHDGLQATMDKEGDGQQLPESIRLALHLDDGSKDPMMRPTLLLSTGLCLVLVVAMIANQCQKALLRMSGSYFTHALLWPLAVVATFYVHTMCVFRGLYEKLTGHHTVMVMMLISAVWCFGLFVYETWVKKCPPCADRELFVAWDVYADLTESSFNVTVRFVFQAILCLILLYVAQTYVDSGFPQNIPFWRVLLNFGIALSLELYLFVQCKQHYTWEDMLRLRTVNAVETVYKYDHEERLHKLRWKPKIFGFRGGDFYIRLAMSIVTNGVFHKFLILSYPVFIFADFGATGWTDVVKDILAITIVTQLDNLVRPTKFIVLTGSAGDALLEQKKKRARSMMMKRGQVPAADLVEEEDSFDGGDMPQGQEEEPVDDPSPQSRQQLVHDT